MTRWRGDCRLGDERFFVFFFERFWHSFFSVQFYTFTKKLTNKGERERKERREMEPGCCRRRRHRFRPLCFFFSKKQLHFSCSSSSSSSSSSESDSEEDVAYVCLLRFGFSSSGGRPLSSLSLPDVPASPPLFFFFSPPLGPAPFSPCPAPPAAAAAVAPALPSLALSSS